jgi:hypothetical protein
LLGIGVVKVSTFHEINACGLEGYTDHEMNNFSGSRKIEVALNRGHIRDFVIRAAAGDIDGKKLLIGKVGDKLAQKIYCVAKIDLSGYNLELRSNQVKHAMNRHGNEKAEALRGQQAITVEDIINLPSIVCDFDVVSVGKDSSLHFVKDINGATTAVTVHAAGKRSLSLQTMYKKKKQWKL